MSTPRSAANVACLASDQNVDATQQTVADPMSPDSVQWLSRNFAWKDGQAPLSFFFSPSTWVTHWLLRTDRRALLKGVFIYALYMHSVPLVSSAIEEAPAPLYRIK